MPITLKADASRIRPREMGLWAALLMMTGQHFFDGPLQDPQVASSVGAGLGIWAAFRYLVKPTDPGGK